MRMGFLSSNIPGGNNTLEKTFRKKLIKLVLPITLQKFFYALIPVSDAVMLVALNQDAMSAVSLATQVQFVLQLFIFAITSGESMLAAQFWGKKDKTSVESILAYCVKLTLPISLLFFLATMLIPDKVMMIFTNDPSIIEYGCDYLRIVSCSYLFISLILIFETILKNTDLVKPVTVISLSMVVMNIVFNAIFIFGLFGLPKMEAAGAALSTTLTEGIALIAVIIIFIKKGKIKFRSDKLLSVPETIKKDFIKYTSPILANQLTWGIGFTMINVIIGHLNSDAIAANSIAVVVKDLISCFCFSLGTGGAILVGNELGAGNLDIAKEYGGRLCKIGIITGVLSGILIGIISPLVAAKVNLTETASHYLQIMLLMCIYYMIGRTMNGLVISGIFCAGGDTRFGFVCDTITMWGFIIPVGILTSFILKLPVLVTFFVLNLDEMVKLPFVYKHYKKYLWVKNLTIQNNNS